jgi:putative Mg2+ transporter-C (MgtC) family protein
MEELRWDLIFLARATLASMLAFAVGWERERRGSPAGDRTYAMVALGAAAFTTVGVESFPATAEKLIAGVVTGVGFLGAGMIMKEGTNVLGLTTAASIWAVAAIGVVVGAGEYAIGVGLTALMLLILECHHLPVISRIAATPDDRRYRSQHAGAAHSHGGAEHDHGQLVPPVDR